MNIAIGGIAHETNTFSTLPTDLADFTVKRGDEVLSDKSSQGFWREARERGHEPFPILHARATPSGKVTEFCFDVLLAELLEGLKAVRQLDGVLLFLHGAMEVEEIGDGETAILRAVRDVVGDDILIAVTLDLHANLAPAVADMAQIVTAYRTAPHRDAVETRLRGARLLLECLERDVRPVVYLVKLPLIVAGEAAVTEVAPARDLIAELPAVIDRAGVLDASILIGCAWTDSPFTTVSTLACGPAPVAVRSAAKHVAKAIWEKRGDFEIDSVTAPESEAISLALGSDERPVFISDSGDNPTAGAAGDSPIFLKHLLSESKLQPSNACSGVCSGARSGARSGIALVAGIADGDSVAVCFERGVGSKVKLSVGGRLDNVHTAPLDVCAKVTRLVHEDLKFGNVAILQIGGIDVVLQTERRPFTEMDDFLRVKLDPNDYRMVVVKLGYLFPELRDSAPKHIMALSPGFGDQRIDRLPFRRLKRPIFPLDQNAKFIDPDQ